MIAKRPFASAIKPILYAAALEGGMNPCSYFDNDSVVFSDRNDWSPQNYDRSSGGKYSMVGSLKKSMNIPTIDLYFKTGYEAFEEVWTDMGFESELSEDPANALGAVDASLMEAVRAYAVFANGGMMVQPYFVDSIKTFNGTLIYSRDIPTEKKRVLEEETVQNMNAMLMGVVEEGTAQSMKSTYGVRTDFAGKTGTAQNYADAWFICYNSNLVMGSRAGASMPNIHFKTGAGSGSQMAFPVVAKTVREIERSSQLYEQYIEGDTLEESVAGVHIDCEDFKEDNFFDKILKPFEKEETTVEKKKKRRFSRK